MQPTDTGKRTTWAELFFDLVFVFAATQVSELLHRHRGWTGVGNALVVFVPMYWAWVGTTVYTNRRNVENARDILGLFGLGLAVFGMALAVPGATTTLGPLFGCAYLLLRIVLTALSFREWRGVRLNAYTVGVTITGPLLLIGGLVDGAARVALWGLAAAADLAGPWVFRNQLARVRFDTGHLTERFGLLVLIALGESLVRVGMTATGDPLSPLRLTAVAATYAIAGSLWWTYFVFAIRGVGKAFETPDKAQVEIIRPVLSYAHVLFIGSVIAGSVGAAEAVGTPAKRLPAYPAALLVVGTALFLATFGYARWRLFHTVSRHRLGTAVACLCLLPIAGRVPALAVLLGLAGLTATLNVVEGIIVRRNGLGHLWHIGETPEP